jgi:hypothetical protein
LIPLALLISLRFPHTVHSGNLIGAQQMMGIMVNAKAKACSWNNQMRTAPRQESSAMLQSQHNDGVPDHRSNRNWMRSHPQREAVRMGYQGYIEMRLHELHVRAMCLFAGEEEGDSTHSSLFLARWKRRCRLCGYSFCSGASVGIVIAFSFLPASKEPVCV